MEASIEEIRQLFETEQLILAGEKIKLLESQGIDVSSIDFIQAIKQDLAVANECLDLLTDMDEWTLVKQSDDIATFTKGSSNQFLVRTEMLLKHSVFPILALFSECELLKEWVPILQDARVLATPTKFRRIIHYFFKLPWPIDNRDAVVTATGIPIPDNKSVLIVLKSIEADRYLGIPIPATETVRMNMDLACLNITYVSENETQISLIARCDVKLALIPVAIINYATKHGIYYFMEAIRQKCQEYEGSEFERLVRSKPEYYDEIRRRITQFLENE